MQSVFSIILVLGLLIAFHELGHFLMARIVGIGVRTFSVGFGPKLIRVVHGQTQYCLSAIPLGGYVHLVGENKDDELPEGFRPEQSFAAHPAWHRMLVVFAGPFFNLILAWLLFWGWFWMAGIPVDILPAVGGVEADSPAEAAGLEAGDLILSIDGQDMSSWGDLTSAISGSDGKELDFTIQRGEEVFDVAIAPRIMTTHDMNGETFEQYMIGIGIPEQFSFEEAGFFKAMYTSLLHTGDVTVRTVMAFVSIIKGEVNLRDNLGGPIMIAGEVSKRARQGLGQLLVITAVISINLAIINLLPIPVLDGGHIMFFTYETIFGRPVNEKVQDWTFKAGLTFLLVIMAMAVYNDIRRYVDWLP